MSWRRSFDSGSAVSQKSGGNRFIMACKPDVLRRGHHDVGDHAALQAAHPVGQHLARRPAEALEALRQHRQRRVRPLISGEPHEPNPGPGQHRAEHVQAALGAPVDHQVLTRRLDRRAAAAVMLLPSQPLPLRDQPAEVPHRPGIPACLRRRQQPLRRDPARRLPHPPGDQLRDAVIVMAAARRSGAAPPASCRAITRLTVLCVVPVTSAAPRYVPTSR